MRCALPLVASLTALAGADAPVTVTVKPMTFRVESSALGEAARGSQQVGSGYYPRVDPTTKQRVSSFAEETVDVVILDNGLVEAWVIPAYGARLVRAVDKRTQVDYFHRRMIDGTWVFDNKLAWSPGGVKASYPFFEHGLHLHQPTGWRVVTGSDGSATVAMDQRFTQFRAVADKDRYGRYGEHSLDIMVTLRPGTTAVTWRQRTDNPNPLPRGDRFWNVVGFPVDATRKPVTEVGKDGASVTKLVPDMDVIRSRIEFLFPATWVVDHGPTAVHTSPHWSARDNFNVSHFAVEAPYRFSGGWYPQENLNRLRISDPQPGPGGAAKLWTAPGVDLFEVWGGHGIVFEKPGELIPGYAPLEFTHRLWVAAGIGRVELANDDVAVGIADGMARLVAPRHGVATVTDGDGKPVAEGPIGPHTVLSGPFTGSRLVVRMGGAVVLDERFPIARPTPSKDTPIPPAIQQAYAALIAPDPLFFEKQCVGRNQGAPGMTDGIDQAVKLLKTGVFASGEAASLARTAYRLGRLDIAEQLAAKAGGPEGDLVLGLIAVERGQPTQFGDAGWQADFLRALQAKRNGDVPGAIAKAEAYLAQVPNAWYPRLAVALWRADAKQAQALADENPASPEAQLVLHLLQQPNELDRLTAADAAIAEHVAAFRAQVVEGVWKPLPRYLDAVAAP